MTDQWQPGRLYAPGDIVQPRITDPVLQSALDNPTFESGDTGWATGGGFSIVQEDPYAGLWAAKFSASVIMGITGSGAQPSDNLVRSFDGGLTWSESDIGFPLLSAPRITVAPALGKWVISDLITSKMFQSIDGGANWTEITKAGDAMVNTRIIRWIPELNLFIAGEALKIFSSPDAITWTQIATVGGTPESIAYDPIGDILLVDGTGGNSVNFSDDGGATWSVKAIAMSSPTGFIWATGTDLFMCARSGGFDVATSPDGVAWTVHTSVTGSFSSIPNPFAYDPVQDRWVKIGGGGSEHIEHSDDDGATWTAAGTHDDTQNYTGVIWDATHSLFVTQEGTSSPHNFYTSPDGNVWTLRVATPGASVQHTAVGGAQSVETMENDARLAVTPGQQITAQVFAKITGASSATVGIAWHGAADVLLSTSFSDSPIVLTGAYRRISATDVAPENALTCSVVLRVGGAGEQVLFDNVTISHTDPVTISLLLFKATQAAPGFSDSFEPTWPTIVGNTVVDNEVTWEGVPANRVLWQAFPILFSGSSEPTFPAAVGAEVADNTISWVADTRRVLDSNCPNTAAVAITASKIFAGDKDIIPFSATVNPLDWSTEDDAGFIPFGLNTYGSQDVSSLGLYRSNLVAFNAKGFQMWQVDEDPQNFAILDAVPIGVPATANRSLQPVMNDLVFLTEVGIRSMGIAGASTNLQAGSFGKQIDPLVKIKLDAGEIPISLYYPGQGQYWLIFGAEAFVLTMNGGKDDMSWSRYVFPSDIDDWTILNKDLFLRSGDKIWRLDEDAERDDQVGDPATSGTTFVGKVEWPYLDFGRFGGDKQMIGFDLVATGEVKVTFGYDQTDLTKVTDDFTLSAGDTLPGTIVPMPITAPSFQLRLEFSADQNVPWEWSGAILYVEDIGT